MDSETEDDKFIVVYNLHIYVIQATFAFAIGLFEFNWIDFVFCVSWQDFLYWIAVGFIINVRWLLEHFFNVEFDNFNLEKNFAYKLLSIVFAHFFINLLNVQEIVSNIEWIAYFVLLLSALYINSLQHDIEAEHNVMEQARKSFNSGSMKYLSRNGSDKKNKTELEMTA